MGDYCVARNWKSKNITLRRGYVVLGTNMISSKVKVCSMQTRGGGNSDSKERQKPNWNFQDLRSKIQTHPGDRTRSSPVDRIDLGPCPNIHQFPYYNKAAIAANPPAIPAPIPATF
jgi:hypothetical protein